MRVMIMKYIRAIKRAFIFAALVGGGMFQSCNFLDIDPYITDLFT